MPDGTQSEAVKSWIIFLVGGGLGVLFAWAGLRLADPNRLLPVPFPLALDLVVNWRVLGFVAALTAGTGLVFGLVTLTWVFSGLLSMNPWGVLDVEGAAVPLSSFWAERPAVLVFLRHFG